MVRAAARSEKWSELDRRLTGLNQTRQDCLYYAITLTADDSLKITFATQSRWVGRADEERRVEIRKARAVYPKFAELWAGLRQPYSIIHSPDELMLFWLGGGNALVEQTLAEQALSDLLGADPAIPHGAHGFNHPQMYDPTAFRRAPTPKLRMHVLKRDNRRCRICGRRPDDDVDVELNVHHIRPWANGGVTDLSNLITLCRTCHKGLDPHCDHSLFGYLAPSAPDETEVRLQELLRGIANYRKIGFIDGAL